MNNRVKIHKAFSRLLTYSIIWKRRCLMLLRSRIIIFFVSDGPFIVLYSTATWHRPPLSFPESSSYNYYCFHLCQSHKLASFASAAPRELNHVAPSPDRKKSIKNIKCCINILYDWLEQTQIIECNLNNLLVDEIELFELFEFVCFVQSARLIYFCFAVGFLQMEHTLFFSKTNKFNSSFIWVWNT